ncbi:DUF805 domain-containing protein [Ferrovibrio sp.]|uniref:DUF805 domain-containing protein n=1 Tax=Ferrovibrio sp. TaxID=1917215 RepID=UPI000CB5576B|nr:DUF805 domain-containing protein [Ferrovibrio sp.]PJI41978.1 MAG: hypothetical protein CTR53_05875 [Ferrovibrio sp.]
MSKPVFSDLFRLSGRRNRKSYSLLLLFCLVGWAVALMGLLNIATTTWGVVIGAGTGLLVYAFGNAVIWIAGAQRCRDMGWPGWLMLVVAALCIVFQPLIFLENLSVAMTTVVVAVTAAVWLFLLWLCIVLGTPGPNKYGPDPLEPLP